MSAALSFAMAERPRPRPIAPEAVPVYAFLAAALALVPVLFARAGLRLALDDFGIIACVLMFMVWLALCLRGRGFARVATAIEAWALFTGICVTVTLLTFVLAANPRPLADIWLARADRAIAPWLDWPGTMLALARTGHAVGVANRVYQSIGWQPQLLVVILAMTAAYRRVWHFLLSWITTLCIVMLVFAFCPALGAYAHFGIAAADVPAMRDPTPWHQPEVILGLRSGTLRLIDLGTLDGIVTFPSFHAGAAVLLTYAFWTLRPLRWPFAALNAAMLVSAVPIGGHYLIDIVAGVIVAIAGLCVTTAILDRVVPRAGTPDDVDISARYHR